MALIINTSNDIRNYEPKLFLSFTFKQTIWLSIALFVGITAGVIIPGSFDTKILIGGLCGTPFGICGFLKPNRTPFEIWIIRVFYRKYLAPTKRKKRNFISLKLKSSNETKNKIRYSRNPDYHIFR